MIRSYETVLDRDATVAIKHADGTTTYPLQVIEDRPPTIERGPLTVNQSGSFQLAYNVTDDYGVTEGKVTFRAGQAARRARGRWLNRRRSQCASTAASRKLATARVDGRLGSPSLCRARRSWPTHW